jgi:hypothetical protein
LQTNRNKIAQYKKGSEKLPKSWIKKQKLKQNSPKYKKG